MKKFNAGMILSAFVVMGIWDQQNTVHADSGDKKPSPSQWLSPEQKRALKDEVTDYLKKEGYNLNSLEDCNTLYKHTLPLLKYNPHPNHENDFVAAQLLKVLARQRFTLAEHALGTCYLEGRGVQQNHAKAFWFLIHSAQKGLSESQHHVGSLLLKFYKGDIDLDASFIASLPPELQHPAHWFHQASSKGYPASANALACLFLDVNPEFLPWDPQAAWAYFLVAAIQDQQPHAALAQYHLGNISNQRSDFNTAEYWLTKAHAFPPLQRRCLHGLGLAAYHQGQFDKAHQLFSQAAENGIAKAAENLQHWPAEPPMQDNMTQQGTVEKTIGCIAPPRPILLQGESLRPNAEQPEQKEDAFVFEMNLEDGLPFPEFPPEEEGPEFIYLQGLKHLNDAAREPKNDSNHFKAALSCFQKAATNCSHEPSQEMIQELYKEGKYVHYDIEPELSKLTNSSWKRSDSLLIRRNVKAFEKGGYWPYDGKRFLADVIASAYEGDEYCQYMLAEWMYRYLFPDLDLRDVLGKERILGFLFHAAETKNHPHALFILGKWYHEGFYVEQSDEKASELLSRAIIYSKKGHKEAKTLLQEISPQKLQQLFPDAVQAPTMASHHPAQNLDQDETQDGKGEIKSEEPPEQNVTHAPDTKKSEVKQTSSNESGKEGTEASPEMPHTHASTTDDKDTQTTSVPTTARVLSRSATTAADDRTSKKPAKKKKRKKKKRKAAASNNPVLEPQQQFKAETQPVGNMQDPKEPETKQTPLQPSNQKEEILAAKKTINDFVALHNNPKTNSQEHSFDAVYNALRQLDEENDFDEVMALVSDPSPERLRLVILETSDDSSFCDHFFVIASSECRRAISEAARQIYNMQEISFTGIASLIIPSPVPAKNTVLKFLVKELKNLNFEITFRRMLNEAKSASLDNQSIPSPEDPQKFYSMSIEVVQNFHYQKDNLKKKISCFAEVWKMPKHREILKDVKRFSNPFDLFGPRKRYVKNADYFYQALENIVVLLDELSGSPAQDYFLDLVHTELDLLKGQVKKPLLEKAHKQLAKFKAYSGEKPQDCTATQTMPHPKDKDAPIGEPMLKELDEYLERSDVTPANKVKKLQEKLSTLPQDSPVRGEITRLYLVKLCLPPIAKRIESAFKKATKKDLNQAAEYSETIAKKLDEFYQRMENLLGEHNGLDQSSLSILFPHAIRILKILPDDTQFFLTFVMRSIILHMQNDKAKKWFDSFVAQELGLLFPTEPRWKEAWEKSEERLQKSMVEKDADGNPSTPTYKDHPASTAAETKPSVDPHHSSKVLNEKKILNSLIVLHNFPQIQHSGDAEIVASRISENLAFLAEEDDFEGVHVITTDKSPEGFRLVAFPTAENSNLYNYFNCITPIEHSFEETQKMQLKAIEVYKQHASKNPCGGFVLLLINSIASCQMLSNFLAKELPKLHAAIQNQKKSFNSAGTLISQAIL